MNKHISILPAKNEYLGIGMMSGSSLDGIDLAAVKFVFQKGLLHSFEIVQAQTYLYEEKWISRLEHLPYASAVDFAKTHVFYGHYVGEKIQTFCKEFDIEPDFVAAHGHTIFHQPEKRFTFQVGCGQTIVSYLQCPLVNDFRSKDVAIGGQGAPLVPLVEKELFPEVNVFINLGGFANISIYHDSHILGYDLTACNRILNYYAWKYAGLPYDTNGILASQGKINSELLNEIHAIQYFHQKPPKSLGNEWLEQNIFPLLDSWVPCIGFKSVLATWVEHIAMQIHLSLQNFENQIIMITGGGAKNHFLLQRIHVYLRNHKVLQVSEKIMDYKESVIFAYLGLKTLLGKTHVLLPQITGGKATILGSIHLV